MAAPAPRPFPAHVRLLALWPGPSGGGILRRRSELIAVFEVGKIDVLDFLAVFADEDREGLSLPIISNDSIDDPDVSVVAMLPVTLSFANHCHGTHP